MKRIRMRDKKMRRENNWSVVVVKKTDLLDLRNILRE
jgi:hypothetical protein